MYHLSEENKIDFPKELLDKVAALDVQKEKDASTSTERREEYQYGTDLSIDETLYKELFLLAQKVIDQTKKIMEK